MSQRVVIFDGPDMCGKTNIAKALSGQLDIPYFKNIDEHKYFLTDKAYFCNAIRYVDTYFTSYLQASGASVILDRAWPSEWIYSQALNRCTFMDVINELDTKHAAMGTKIVIPFRTDYSMVKDDYDVINENIQKIHDLYMAFAEWSKCDTLLINVDDENLDRELAEINAFLGTE